MHPVTCVEDERLQSRSANTSPGGLQNPTELAPNHLSEVCRETIDGGLIEQGQHLIGAGWRRPKLNVRGIKLAGMGEVGGHTKKGIRMSAGPELVLFEQEADDVIVHSVKRVGCTTVRSVR
jgi:hypothetical protein